MSGKIYETLGLGKEEANKRAGAIADKIAQIFEESKTYSEFAKKMEAYYNELCYTDRLIIWVTFEYNTEMKLKADSSGGE